MKRKNYLIAIGITVISLIVLGSGVYFFMLSNKSQTEVKSNPVSSNSPTPSAQSLNEQTNESAILETIAKPFTKDVSSGIVFHTPEGYDVNTKDEYYTVSNLENEKGSIFVCISTDYVPQAEIDIYQADYGLKSRAKYQFGSREYETVLYDTGDINEEMIGSVKSITEKTQPIIQSGDDSIRADAVYYHSINDRKATTVGCLTKADATEQDKQTFIEAAQKILTNMQAIQFSGKQLAPISELTLSSIDFGDYNVPYPTDWTKYEKSGSITFKAPAETGNIWDGMSIVYYTTPLLDEDKTELGVNTTRVFFRNSITFANGLMQHPEIDNNRRIYAVFSGIEELQINGHQYMKTSTNGTIKVDNMRVETTLPTKDIFGYYYILAENNQILQIYVADVPGKKDLSRTLADKLVNAIQ